MERSRFDFLTRAVATNGSRRRVLGGLLAGAMGSRWVSSAAADDSGVTFADASGGNANLATVAESENDAAEDEDNAQAPCQPESARKLCRDRCDRVVDDGCGGRIECTCDGNSACARRDGVCCQPERLRREEGLLPRE